jgi:hypothetical protein
VARNSVYIIPFTADPQVFLEFCGFLKVFWPDSIAVCRCFLPVEADLELGSHKDYPWEEPCAPLFLEETFC